MTTTIEIWEDTGPVVSGYGTTRTQVTNCNWKNSGTVAIPYYSASLRRPDDDTGWALSFTKYLYFKVITDKKLKNFKIQLSSIPGLNTQLYGVMTSVYETPATLLSKGIFINGAMVFYPRMGLDPSTATTCDAVLNNGTFTTEYLATQLRVINSNAYDVGNTTDVVIKFTFSEY